MSISAALKSSNGSSKKSWTKDELRTVVLMTLAGATQEQIAESTGHPKASVGYAIRNKLNTEANVEKFTGFTSLEEAQAELAELSEAS